jgi:riboflavin biosynthesis pyrimidine reductase
LRPSRDHAPPLIVAAQPRGASPKLRSRQKILEAVGAEVLFLPPDKDGHVALASLLHALATREVQSLLVEGGSRIHGAFIRQRLVDSVAVFLAPRLVGCGVPIVESLGLDWENPARLGPLEIEKLGSDVLFTADVIEPGKARHSS